MILSDTLKNLSGPSIRVVDLERMNKGPNFVRKIVLSDDLSEVGQLALLRANQEFARR